MVCITTTRTEKNSSSDAISNQSSGSDINVGVIDKDSNIRVIVRVRPSNVRERATESAIKVMGPHCLVFDPDEENTDEFGNRSAGRKQHVLGRKARDLKFAFDRVLDERADNQHAYNHSAKFVVDGVLSGYNCSVFAYGATGAGKTHTMLGTKAEPGVMYRTMEDLYAYMDKVSDQCCVDVSVSYLEVYNEDVCDLLMPKRCSLPVREDPQHGVLVQGLSLHKPQSMKELLHMLDFGNTNRSQHPTDANAESSRSHAVFQVFIRQKPRDTGLQAKIRCAKMSLIDLAGSERATVTKNLGKRFREGANINRSLLALGNVINSLASGKTKGKHVPYRDSKLTRILKDSLGGNCRTVMIAAVSPSHLSYEDTYNTLRYAERTKSIKAAVRENVLSVDLHIHNYAKIVEELRSENRDLREKLSIRPPPTPAPSVSKHVVDPDLLGLKVHIDNVYSERANLHRELMEIESNDRELQLKLYHKQQSLLRFQMICLSRTDIDAARVRCEAGTRALDQRRSNLGTRRQKALQRLHDNAEKLAHVHDDCRAVADDQSFPEVVSLTDELRRTEIQLADQKRQVKYLKKMARQQQREMDVRDRLLTVALTALRQQYMAAVESGQLLPDTYRQLVQLVCEQNREVVWADQTNLSSEAESASFNIQNVLNFPPMTPAAPAATSSAPGRSPRRHTPRSKRSARSPRTKLHENTTAELQTTVPMDDTSPQLTEAAGRTPFPKLCLDTPLLETEKTQKANFGLRAAVDSVESTSKGVRTPHIGNRTDNCDSKKKKVNSSTVTKDGRTDNATFTRPPSAALFNPSATVTKAPVNNENAPLVKRPCVDADDGSRRSSAARAMTFTETPKRDATFSYADVLKSPPATAAVVESPLAQCIISPIALTPAATARKQRTPCSTVSHQQRTPAGSVRRIRSEFCGSPLLSSSPKQLRQSIRTAEVIVTSPVLNESYTIPTSTALTPKTSSQPPSQSKLTSTTVTSLKTTPSTSSSLTPLTSSHGRRPLTDQANVMTSRLPVKSPCDDRGRRVQFDDQENRRENLVKDSRKEPPDSRKEPQVSRGFSEHAKKLEHYGLPALSVPMDRKHVKKTAPGYMRMTHAAEGKARPNNGRTSQQRQSRDAFSGGNGNGGGFGFKRSISLNRLDGGQTMTFTRTRSTTTLIPGR